MAENGMLLIPIVMLVDITCIIVARICSPIIIHVFFHPPIFVVDVWMQQQLLRPVTQTRVARIAVAESQLSNHIEAIVSDLIELEFYLVR